MPTPSPYYRVSIKAIVLHEGKMLLCKDREGRWEVPGGGWEHDESFEAALGRELAEELHVDVQNIGNVQCIWRDYSPAMNIHFLRIGVPVVLKSHDFRPDDGGLVEARFVTYRELIRLPFQEAEKGVLDCTAQIWPNETTSTG